MKIIDFGVSQILDSDKEYNWSEISGTFRYMAPELLKNKVCLKSDIWAYGCILLELSMGIKCFNGLNEFSLNSKLMQKISPVEHAIQNNNQTQFIMDDENKGLLELIKKCFQFDPKKRPSSTEILKDKFFDDLL